MWFQDGELLETAGGLLDFLVCVAGHCHLIRESDGTWVVGLGVDDDWVVAFDVEDADLKQRPICCWADKHGQVVIQRYPSHRVANGMPYVRVGDPVLARWLGADFGSAKPKIDIVRSCARRRIPQGRPMRKPARVHGGRGSGAGRR